MSALTFTLKTDLKQRLDCSPLTPDALQGQSAAEIAALSLQYGNRPCRADALFDIDGENRSALRFAKASGKLDCIGKGMTTGTIAVEGDAGGYLGMQMRGGRIDVSGSAGAYVACEMKQGAVFIRGHAGDFLGSPLPGNRKGMTGGLVVVAGNAGDRVGDHMRRGVILIEGDAGGYLGSRMIAGTIAVRGRVGPHLGYGMNRGTLLLFQEPGSIPPTFNDCGTHSLGFLPLLLKSFPGQETGFGALEDRVKRVRRYAGDLAVLGKGEILVAL